jgi:murein L,D-transpeptidase YcbB/YkuD
VLSRIAPGLSIVLLLLNAGLPAAIGAERQAWAEQTDVFEIASELLRNRIEAAGYPPQLAVGDEVIYTSKMLPAFYERRAYRLAWSGGDGLLPQIDSLIAAVEDADAQGLRPQDYHLGRIKAAIRALPFRYETRRPVNPGLLADLDLLLTDAFLMYAYHLQAGRLNPETIDPEWYIMRPERDLADVLEAALASNRIRAALEDLLPRDASYRELRRYRSSYLDLAARGGWGEVPPGAKLQKGDRGARVGALRERLEASGYLRCLDGDEDLFDDALQEAVREFQARHGLDTDGVVGPRTLAAINVSPADRARQIEVNMERWRWLPRDLGERYVMINIADFDLRVVEAHEILMEMRVMVGRDYRQTPVFSDVMTYLVLSPYWNVPWSIAVKDKLPLIKENPAYLTQQKIRVFSGWGADAEEIDPLSVDWSEVTPASFKYRLRQDPGPQNALGRIKFMFPNKFNVYLHDTPSRDLFNKTVRAFSSGCIRIEKPLELAEYLLRADPKWTRAALIAAIDKSVEQTVRLPEPIAVHVLYCTAWVDEDGVLQLRDDIYGRDQAILEGLREPPPAL